MLSKRQCLECYTIVIGTCRSISLITFQSGCFTAKNPVDCSCVKIKLVNRTLITHGNKNLVCVSVCIQCIIHTVYMNVIHYTRCEVFLNCLLSDRSRRTVQCTFAVIDRLYC